jgi:hypothetical protein
VASKNASLIDKLSKNPLPGRVQFLSQKDEIKAAIDKGFDGKAIWTELINEKKITISYSVFMTYVRSIIQSKKSTLQKTSVSLP